MGGKGDIRVSFIPRFLDEIPIPFRVGVLPHPVHVPSLPLIPSSAAPRPVPSYAITPPYKVPISFTSFSALSNASFHLLFKHSFPTRHKLFFFFSTLSSPPKAMFSLYKPFIFCSKSPLPFTYTLPYQSLSLLHNHTCFPAFLQLNSPYQSPALSIPHIQ